VICQLFMDKWLTTEQERTYLTLEWELNVPSQVLTWAQIRARVRFCLIPVTDEARGSQ
jgi:hypothetical protein